MRTRDITDVLLFTAALLAYLQYKFQHLKPARHIQLTMHRTACALLVLAAAGAIATPIPQREWQLS